MNPLTWVFWFSDIGDSWLVGPPGGGSASDAVQPLSDILIPRRETIRPSEVSAERHMQITVHQTGTISERRSPGAMLSGGALVRPGDLVASRINTHNGLIAVFPESNRLGVVSNEYPVFRGVDNTAAPFAAELLRTDTARASLREMATGGTRQRVSAQGILGLEFPIPDAPSRQQILQRLNRSRQAAAASERRASEIELAAQLEFERCLTEPQDDLTDRPLWWIFQFSDIVDRWIEPDTPQFRFKYPTKELRQVAELRLGTQIPRAGSDGPGQPHPYLRAANVQRGRLDLRHVKQMRVTDAQAERLSLSPDDVVFVEGNSFDEVGRCARVDASGLAGYVFQNSVVRVRFPPELVISEFAEGWFNSIPGGAYFKETATTTSGTLYHIGVGKLSRAPLPVPPLDVQRDLVTRLSGARQEAARLRQEAARLRDEADRAFEQAVFGGLSTEE